jgi:hypothetical protein
LQAIQVADINPCPKANNFLPYAEMQGTDDGLPQFFVSFRSLGDFVLGRIKVTSLLMFFPIISAGLLAGMVNLAGAVVPARGGMDPFGGRLGAWVGPLHRVDLRALTKAVRGNIGATAEDDTTS